MVAGRVLDPQNTGVGSGETNGGVHHDSDHHLPHGGETNRALGEEGRKFPHFCDECLTRRGAAKFDRRPAQRLGGPESADHGAFNRLGETVDGGREGSGEIAAAHAKGEEKMIFSALSQSTWITALANHLWQSTVFVAAACLLAVVLRRNQARTRFWLWMAASVKFLVPLSLLIAAGEWLHLKASIAGAHPAFFTAMNDVTRFTQARCTAPQAQHNHITTCWFFGGNQVGWGREHLKN